MGLLQECLLIFLLLKVAKDMFMPISPIYALFPINSVLEGLRCYKCFHCALNLNPCCKREAKLRFASMQKPEAPSSCDTEIRFFE